MKTTNLKREQLLKSFIGRHVARKMFKPVTLGNKRGAIGSYNIMSGYLLERQFFIEILGNPEFYYN
jgi:hypothetical protein